MTRRRLRLLGAEMDALTRPELMAAVEACAAEDQPTLIGNHNLHSLSLIRRDPSIRGVYDLARVIQIDSMPAILWGRLLGAPVGREHRNTYLDWREDFWALAARRGWRVYHLGCKPGVGAKAAEILRARWPGAVIAERDGYFDVHGADNGVVLAEIRAFAPDILFVGMGMPRQEAWISANWRDLPDAVVFPIGAAFDYEAGVVPTPPRWAGRLGLEWFARFLAEPGRLFHRYFIEPWSLVPAMAGDVARAFNRRRGDPPQAPETSLTGL